jgi:hypothetical protein
VIAAIVQIQRDAFARATLERTMSDDPKERCGWCGCRRPGGRRLFRYRWLTDGVRQRAADDWDKGAFCQVSCYRALHGE